MSAITRRSFLGAPLALALAPQAARSGSPTRIYSVFFSVAPSEDDTGLRPIPHEEIVRRLEKACPGVEFTVRDLTRDAQMAAVLNEARDLKRLNYDGVIVYGWPRDYDLLRTGLPTINVAVLNDFMNIPYPVFRQNRTVGAMLDPWRFCADPAVSERMFQDLAAQIKLIGMLKRMKSEHILTVTDSKYVNVFYGDLLKSPPARYNETMLAAIDQTFGTKVTRIGSKEVTEDKDIQNLWHNDSREAKQIAQRWIRAAQKMTYTIEPEIVRSAKLYLAMKMLMEKHGATAMAFHIRALVKDARPEDMVFPALAVSEFQLHNTVAKCQSHLNILLSEMMLQYAYGRPSMLGDYSVDTYNNTSCVQHCEGPWNPWGDRRRTPYILTDHRERRVRARNATGVGGASWVLYPAGEPVTMWQIEVLNKEILVHTGKTVHMLAGPVKYRDHLWEMM
ncbi:MAG: hypothetical protein IT158_28220 [Bryobacterales bacterium]|nr:hypothetical protein [Bryobacterales bacterium]